MKVLYFHQHFSTPKGAIGNRSYQFAKRLVAHGHQVTMVCGSYTQGDTGLDAPFRRGIRRGRVDGIDVVEFHLPISNSDTFVRRTIAFLQFAARCCWLAATQRYDLVFATSTPLTAGIPGIVGRWLRRKPFVFEVRDLWPELPKEMGIIKSRLVLGALSALELATYRSAHRLIGLSPGIVDGIAKRNVQRESIAMIPNGCDLDIFGDPHHDIERPSWVQPGDLLAIFAGAHGRANGLDALLNAAIELRRRGRDDIKIALIGSGMLKPRLVARAEEHRLTNVVFRDPMEKNELAALMAAADVGIQCLANVPAFYYGTSPNKFFDYLAAGLPVVINYPGWLAELIASHRIGYVAAPDDPGALADALESAARDREGLRGMGERARALATRQFDRDDLAEQFVGWLEGATAAGSEAAQSA